MTEANFADLMESLGLIDDNDQVLDTANLPRERSGVPRELPQPGTLRLQVPDSILKTITPVATNMGQRIKLVLKDEHAMTDMKTGLPVNYTISGMEFLVKGKNGQEGAYRSELASFLKATGFEGILDSKAAQLKAIQQAASKEFKADAAYETKCPADRPIYKDGAKQNQVGCGQRYRLKYEQWDDKKTGKVTKILAIPRDENGHYKQKFSCMTEGCGALLSAFLRLSNYRKA